MDTEAYEYSGNYSVINASAVKQKSSYTKVVPSPNIPVYAVVDKKKKSGNPSTPKSSGTDGMYSMITEESMKDIDTGKHLDENSMLSRKVKANPSMACKVEAAKQEG